MFQRATRILRGQVFEDVWPKFAKAAKENPELVPLVIFSHSSAIMGLYFGGHALFKGWDVQLVHRDPFPFENIHSEDEPKVVPTSRYLPPEIFWRLNRVMSEPHPRT